MKKCIVKLFIVVFVLVLLCSCGKTEGFDIFVSTTDNYVYQTAPTSIPYTYETGTSDVSYYTETQPTTHTTFVADSTIPTEMITENHVTEQSPALEPTESPVNTETSVTTEAPVTTEKVYEKTGEMAFSDSEDNKYIKAIVDKYGVNPKNLVALYTVPDNDGNIVLEFDGSTDSDGKLIRNTDTLITIYSIDKNLNSKRASENHTLNEYSYGEMKVMFITTTKHIMPEFEAELNG